MNRKVALLATILLARPLLAQQTGGVAPSTPNRPTAVSKPDGLAIDSVLAMAQAGLSEDLIIAKLRRDARAFDLSSDDMIRLKKANLSDAVLKVMLDSKADIKTSQSAAPPSAPVSILVQTPAVAGIVPVNPSGATPNPGSSVTGDPNDPMTQHESGIYLYTKDRDGKPQMIVLERAAYQGEKTGGLFTSAMTYGIKKAKAKAVIPGPRAGIRTGDPSPIFYFYFDDKAAGLGRSSFGANVSNPNQFALVKLEVTKSNRETIIAEFGAFGQSSGTNSKSMAGFKSERIRAGLYRVVANEPLQPGEYCFLAFLGALGAYGAGAAGAVDLLDFGIGSNQ